MTGLVPCPDPNDRPFNEVVEGRIDVGQRLTATFEPEQRDSSMLLPIVAASKFPGFEYTVEVDGETVFGPTTVPPTDIDDLDTTFLPAHEFDQKVEIVAKNVASANGRDVAVQVIGWEETQ